MSKPNSFYGITRKEEEKNLEKIQGIASKKVASIEETARSLQEDLKSLREVYDADDKEGLAQWFNTDARFAEVRNDLNRAKRACHKPFFGRIDIEDPNTHWKETFYIGKTIIADNPSEPEVIDWRAPVSSVYYDHSLGICDYKVPEEGIFYTDLKRKRTYEIEDEQLIDYYDSDVVANDDLLTKYLSKSKRNVLSEIIATIQQEQNEIIRKDPHHNVLVQGSAGSGKTTVAMHRISYILYNYDREFKPEGFYIVGSNKVLLNYITGVLPDLDVYNVSQMTMEELFVRLLYEDWDRHAMKVGAFAKKDKGVQKKTTSAWFDALRSFCDKTENALISMEDIQITENHHTILTGTDIKRIFHEYPSWSLKQKLERLNDFLRVGLENEIYGKFYSYSADEKKRLNRKYKDWFFRYLPKQSVFTFYEEFIKEQQAVFPEISYIRNEPDLYDLAGLAYLYKRLRETEVIQEASHVVIDEAQDFGMAVYRSLTYCMSKCTFTVMGDVSQNINFGLGLSDWEELKKVLLPDKFDYFGLLRKSYRNTVEISNFATDILRHGTFPIYPVEPIIRHGADVSVTECKNENEFFSFVSAKISDYQKKGYETIAIICSSQTKSEKVCKLFKDKHKINLFSEGNGEFAKGIYAMPIEYSKGLEFDAVIIYDASKNAYPKTDGYARLLYVAATRALHELSVFSFGELTGLIKDPVPEERKHISFAEDDFHKKPIQFEEEFKTKEGDRERALREMYGPKRIMAGRKSTIWDSSSTSKYTGTETSENKLATLSETTCSKPTAGITNGQKNTTDKTNVSSASSSGMKDRVRVPAKNSFRSMDNSGKEKEQNKISVPQSEFYAMPENTSLTPIGHGRIDNAVRWSSTGKYFVDLTSSYGILRITPISAETVRVQFTKKSFDNQKNLPEETPYKEKLKWNCREARETIEITLEKLIVRISKKTGALEFLSKTAGALLSENTTLSRQYHGTKDIWWEYFSWTKKENLTARGETDDVWKDLTQTARYISHGSSSLRPSLIMSAKGYQILVPAGIKTLACTIPAYGPYLCFENTSCIDYLFRCAK